MVNINEIPPFPNVGVQLIKEDEHVAIWQEVFEPGKPTPPHRHMRDYIAVYPKGGEVTIVPVAGEAEDLDGRLPGIPERERSDTLGL
jgi:quercetin dioxygenase-like cupin family protein